MEEEKYAEAREVKAETKERSLTAQQFCPYKRSQSALRAELRRRTMATISNNQVKRRSQRKWAQREG